MVAKLGGEVEKAKREFLFARQGRIHSVQSNGSVRAGPDVRYVGCIE